MPYDFFSWNKVSMPTASAVDGHAVRTFEQTAALSACQPAPQAVGAPDAGHPMSEKNEQYQLFMSDLSQNKQPGAITLKTAANCQVIESQ
ncbi:hypothetical protein [Paraburkholderia sediminicola]|uniref:hypothetical protein n=1 Tax=Paraburkholderia sediminicola TaxID=458836 RepID=UPI0011C44378